MNGEQIFDENKQEIELAIQFLNNFNINTILNLSIENLNFKDFQQKNCTKCKSIGLCTGFGQPFTQETENEIIKALEKEKSELKDSLLRLAAEMDNLRKRTVLDVEKASDAAARYLRDAYRTFGDWSLAISSYNCGAGNIMKAIKRAAGSRNFWDIYPYLKRETRGYVPAFVGVMYAMTYYREYGIEPQDVGMPAAVDTFMIDRKLHFAQINEVVGVPMDIVKHLNPQYIYEVIPGTASRKYALKLPYNWCGPFMDAHPDSLYGHRAAELFESDVIKAASSGKSTRPDNRIVYKVKEGDYLGRIASRHHVTVKQLKSWNNLKSDKLRVGQILYIYK